MLHPPLQTRRWSEQRLEIRGWLNRARLDTGGELDDIMLREFFAEVDNPLMKDKHFMITAQWVNPEELP